MTESILTSTKAGLGVPESHTAFDVEITLFINAVLSRLNQLGIGPKAGFRIIDKTQTWEEFLGEPGEEEEDEPLALLLNNAKSYMVLRVKLLFDPPDIGFVITAMKDQIEKEEWLLNATDGVDDKLLRPAIVVEPEESPWGPDESPILDVI